MIKLVLAAGAHERWSGQRAKQLVAIANELLLERTQRQAGDNCIVVTHLPAIQRHSRAYFIPENHRWTVETLLSTKCKRGDRTVVLLGDVVYSDEAMARILAFDGPVAVFGCQWEIFAVSFSAKAQFAVEAALTVALVDAHQGGRGKLWEFYRAFCGFPLAEPILEGEIFQFITDYTDDIDTVQEYYAFLDKNPWANPPGSRRGLLRSLD